eukprot:12413518-Karenia_brevis.AAC.1
MRVSQSSKRSKVQPFWWFDATRGTAFGPVLEAQWNAAETHYQAKVPRPELRREYQGSEYPKRSEWMQETMLLTAVRRESPKDGAGFNQWHDCEII